MFGVLPLEIFLINGDTTSKTLGLARADMQYSTLNAQGVPVDVRTWVDDMFMITGLQVQAYRATQNMTYLTHATTTMLSYLPALQQSNGLFWHTQTAQVFWGRGTGGSLLAPRSF